MNGNARGRRLAAAAGLSRLRHLDGARPRAGFRLNPPLPMSLLDRIAECNAESLADMTPLLFGLAQIGWVDAALLPRLLAEETVFAARGGALRILEAGSLAATEAALDAALRRIYDRDAAGFGRWCPDYTPVLEFESGRPLFRLQRAAIPALGILAGGVHLNGFCGRGEKQRLWIARRARHIAAQPGKLDQIAAGFLPHGEDPKARLLEEAEEEAGISRELMRAARPSGMVSYRMRRPLGLQIGLIYCYDLELPGDFRPRNADGEVEEFLELGSGALIEILAEGPSFKFDCALVALDFLIRHGWLGPERADYIALCRGLRRS